jgi:hypothetical protein
MLITAEIEKEENIFIELALTKNCCMQDIV